MKWIKINPDDLPEGEVLAANFGGGYGNLEKIIGYVDKNDEGKIVCQNDNEILEGCTHYIDIHKHDDERE